MKIRVLVITLLVSLIVVPVALAAPAAQTTPAPLTPELLAVILAALLSLLTTYVPKFNEWFAALDPAVKQMIMGIATIVVAVVVYILACTPSLGFPFVTCPTGGIWELVGIILLALGVNQGVDRASPEPAKVKAVKAAQKAAAAKS